MGNTDKYLIASRYCWHPSLLIYWSIIDTVAQAAEHNRTTQSCLWHSHFKCYTPSHTHTRTLLISTGVAVFLSLTWSPSMSETHTQRRIDLAKRIQLCRFIYRTDTWSLALAYQQFFINAGTHTHTDHAQRNQYRFYCPTIFKIVLHLNNMEDETKFPCTHSATFADSAAPQFIDTMTNTEITELTYFWWLRHLHGHTQTHVDTHRNDSSHGEWLMQSAIKK